MTSSNWPGPLAGIKVLDFTRVLAGPFLTQMLADLGAEVLKVEPPGSGDDTRAFPPHVGGESHYFIALNRGKESLVIDLRSEEGKEIIRDLVAHVDVLAENYRPGVMDRLGLGYEALSKINPRLVYCSVSGFGLTGPLKDKPSFDIVTQALTGALSINGERGATPVKLGLPLGDMVGGVFGSVAVLSALVERATTGRGRLIDVSLYDGLIGMLGYLSQLALVTGESPEPVGSGHPHLVPYNSFPASNGSIIIACLTQNFWENLAKAIGRPELRTDPRFATIEGRRENRVALEAIIGEITRTATVAAWQERLTEGDVPHAPVLSVLAALNEPHTVAREMVVEVEHPAAGPLRITGRPIKFPGAPQRPLTPPPRLGEHTGAVLARELGLGEDRLADLRRRGVIDRGRTGDE
jgi:crotonobetainyl-CoA:carnitine CoA-transferase CaiB-like acyl-CoA transferase